MMATLLLQALLKCLVEGIMILLALLLEMHMKKFSQAYSQSSWKIRYIGQRESTDFVFLSLSEAKSGKRDEPYVKWDDVAGLIKQQDLQQAFAFLLSPNVSRPKVWTEAWTGWFTGFGEAIPYRPAEDMAFVAARFIQKSGSFINYYMISMYRSKSSCAAFLANLD